MATLTCDARVEKGQPTVAIDCAGVAVLYRAHVATHALCLHWQRGRCVRDRFQTGLHVQTLGGGVVGDGRFEEISVERVEIRYAKMSRSQKVFELACCGDLRIFWIP